jgi:hypothetical protein
MNIAGLEFAPRATADAGRMATKRKGRTVAVAAFAASAVVALGAGAEQVRYLRGQNIAPVYEGWRRDPDGTVRMYFGYLNRNYQEVLDVPVGPNNGFEPGDPDRGQPTHFLTRRQRFVFQVRLAKDWDPNRRLIWTITANGKTEQAHGWMQPEWEIDDGVIQMNLGPGGAPPSDPPNTAPQLTGSPEQTATVDAPLTVSASATDDGIPKPRKVRPGTTPPPGGDGVQIRWIHYRGPGEVKFSQERSERVYGKQVELQTTVTFSAPGTYVLRAIANDGLLETAHDVTVTVKR